MSVVGCCLVFVCLVFVCLVVCLFVGVFVCWWSFLLVLVLLLVLFIVVCCWLRVVEVARVTVGVTVVIVSYC